MKLVAQSAPYIRKPVSVKRMMLDVLIALVPVLLFACIQNGWNGIYVVLISVAAMLVIELVCHMFIKWPSGMKFKELFSKEGFIKIKNQYTINNIIAPLISAIIYALIMPAGCNWYVVLIGAVFGMLIGKMIFGGLGSNIFNPAATGRVFVGVCFGSKLVYGKGGVDVAASGTPLAVVKGNLGMLGQALNEYSLLDLFLGQIPGSMGEVCSLLIIIGGIYLFVRRSADLRACLSMIGSFAVITLVVSIVAYCVWSNQAHDTVMGVDWNVFDLFMYEMLSGGLLFGAVFMITDPVTSPTTKFGRIAFGAMAGIITALVRYCGAYPEGVAFSILIANMFAPAMDYLMRGKKNTYTWKQLLGLGIAMVVICLIVGFSVAHQIQI
ncbi:MAG: RnfABCDGE type electron transport complex subunit D [Roseburia sp.]|nr:RnfABCDGE type electron transport complex subunit D [Anaeroplasma bactoclasticum]MCM1195581.1 RnfABCDGE type electron transport complex subunit D [Roseburia sp.]MCM1556171.1 RnfABCDGE type electron transport complex subunit D [Anaeroplasma bactoclasticum]